MSKKKTECAIVIDKQAVFVSHFIDIRVDLRPQTCLKQSLTCQLASHMFRGLRTEITRLAASMVAVVKCSTNINISQLILSYPMQWPGG